MPARGVTAGASIVSVARCYGAALRAGAMILAVIAATLAGGCATKPPPSIARPVVRPPAPPPAPVANPSTPGEVRAEIVRWFSVHGYKPFQAAALADHARVESGFRPCVDVGDRRYTYQWSGLRLHRLIAYADTGKACPPLAKQLAFADVELHQEPSYWCFWRATTEPEAFRALRRGFGRGRC